jgi:hypothetical protein
MPIGSSRDNEIATYASKTHYSQGTVVGRERELRLHHSGHRQKQHRRQQTSLQQISFHFHISIFFIGSIIPVAVNFILFTRPSPWPSPIRWEREQQWTFFALPVAHPANPVAGISKTAARVSPSPPTIVGGEGRGEVARQIHYCHVHTTTFSTVSRAAACQPPRVAADVRRLIIYDLRLTIDASHSYRQRLVNRKSKKYIQLEPPYVGCYGSEIHVT